jgi:hypothetical protein
LRIVIAAQKEGIIPKLPAFTTVFIAFSATNPAPFDFFGWTSYVYREFLERARYNLPEAPAPVSTG